MRIFSLFIDPWFDWGCMRTICCIDRDYLQVSVCDGWFTTTKLYVNVANTHYYLTSKPIVSFDRVLWKDYWFELATWNCHVWMEIKVSQWAESKMKRFVDNMRSIVSDSKVISVIVYRPMILYLIGGFSVVQRFCKPQCNFTIFSSPN